MQPDSKMMTNSNTEEDEGDIDGGGAFETFNAASKMNDEKFKLIMDLSPQDELHDSFQSIWATIAVVAALFLSFLVGEERFDAESTNPTNMWKHAGLEEVIIELYDLSIGFCIIISTFGMLFSVVLSVQFAHIPKDNTTDYMEEIGQLVNIPNGPYMFTLCAFYLISLMLKYSLAYTTWVAVVLFFLVAFFGGLFMYGLNYAMNRKMKTLRKLKRRKINYETRNTISTSNAAAPNIDIEASS